MVQVGTAYLCCPEATTSPIHRAALDERCGAPHRADAADHRPAGARHRQPPDARGRRRAARPSFRSPPRRSRRCAPPPRRAAAATSRRSGAGQNASGCRERPAGGDDACARRRLSARRRATRPRARRRCASSSRVTRDAYYVRDAPTIPDADYDALFQELQAIEAEHPELVTADSPTQRVIGAVLEGLVPVRHAVPMLSINTETDTTRRRRREVRRPDQEVARPRRRRSAGRLCRRDEVRRPGDQPALRSAACWSRRRRAATARPART